MSRGPGKMQALIMDALRMSSVPTSAIKLRAKLSWVIWDPDNGDPDFEAWNTPARRRSIRMSMGRALRQLESAGQIERDADGNWYPSRDWTGRDNAERERAELAYHEAGHAVVGLALKLPVAFVTIKPRGRTPGHVSYAPIHHSVGKVFARGSYRKPIVDASEQDAFGNPVSDDDNTRDWHADTVMSMAGGVAEAEFSKEGDWRKLWSPSDKRCISWARGKLGDKAGSIEEYEAECQKLIKQHWPMIEAVAAKLLKEETLSGNDVYAICWRTARNVVRQQHLKNRGKAAARSNRLQDRFQV